MTRRPQTRQQRTARVRGSVFLVTIVVIVSLVVAAIVVFGAFMARFGGA